MTRQQYLDATEWQELAGYSRAVRSGSVIAVSGTTSSAPDGAPAWPGDTYAQTMDALQRGLAAVEALGGAPSDVIRSRVYLVPDASWEDAARAHREMLGAVAPANTMLYVAALIGEGLLVEVELEAVISEVVSENVSDSGADGGTRQ